MKLSVMIDALASRLACCECQGKLAWPLEHNLGILASRSIPGGRAMNFAMRQVGLAALAAGVLTLGLSSGASAQRKLSFAYDQRSEEHTSELQSRPHLVCRLLLEKKK